MSSHGSDQISSEKHAAVPEIASAAVPVSHVPKVQGKEKTVHNVSFECCQAVSQLTWNQFADNRRPSSSLPFRRPTSTPGAGRLCIFTVSKNTMIDASNEEKRGEMTKKETNHDATVSIFIAFCWYASPTHRCCSDS
jgi:hypothetical protein